MPTYEQCKTRLESFILSLPKSQIKFLYFLSSDLMTPRVRSELHEWGKHDCFIVNGITPGWCYIYRESVLKHLLTVNSTGMASFGGTEEVNHGDHLTVGLVRKRPDTLVMRSHKTIYEELASPPFTYDRNTIDCSITLDQVGTIVTDNTVCDPTQLQISNLYDKHSISIVQSITQIFYDTYTHGGGCKYITYKAHRYVLRQGERGGKYITYRGERKYINSRKQKGGAPITYKGVSFTTDFIQFLSTYILIPVYQMRSDLDNVQIIYDESSELGENSNKHILFLYDFVEDQRNIFYIDTKKAMTAFFAEKDPNATYEDKAILDEFKLIIPRQFVVQA